MINMTEKIKEGMQLDTIKNVAWYVKGDNPDFNCDWVKVRLEDVTGKIFELVIHNQPYLKMWKNQEEVILNVILATHGIMPQGQWIGTTDSLEQVIDTCRKNFPYTDVFFINEKDARMSDFVTPEYIF